MSEEVPVWRLVDVNGNEVEITDVDVGPGHSCVLTFAPAKRRLPRIRLRHKGKFWEARWIAQNDSWLAQEATTRRAAIRAVIGWARYQNWPLVMRKGEARDGQAH